MTCAFSIPGFKKPQQDNHAEDFEVEDLLGDPVSAAELHQDIFLLAKDSENKRISLISELGPKAVEDVLKGNWNKSLLVCDFSKRSILTAPFCCFVY